MQTYIITFLFSLYVLQDYFTSRYLMQFTLDVVPILQQSFLNPYLQPLYLVITLFGYSNFIFILILLLYLISPNKIQIFKIITLTLFAIYIQNTLKLIYAHPRPYYLSSQIHPPICDSGYGNPSGHAFTSVVFYLLFFDSITFKKYKIIQQDTLQYIHRQDQDLVSKFSPQTRQEQYQQLYPSAFFTFKQSLIILTKFLLQIGFSRIFLGLHGLDQIIYGWMTGLYLLYLYFTKIETFLDRLFYQAIYKKFTSQLDKIKHILIALILYILMTSITVTAYFYQSTNNELIEKQQEWNENISINCPNANFRQQYNYHSLISSGLGTFPIICYLLFIISNGTYAPQSYPSKINNYQNLVRGVILISQVACPIVIVVFIDSFFQEQIYLIYIFQGHLMMIAIAFQLIVTTPWAYVIFRQDVTGDLFRKNQTQLEGQFAMEMEL